MDTVLLLLSPRTKSVVPVPAAAAQALCRDPNTITGATRVNATIDYIIITYYVYNNAYGVSKTRVIRIIVYLVNDTTFYPFVGTRREKKILFYASVNLLRIIISVTFF